MNNQTNYADDWSEYDFFVVSYCGSNDDDLGTWDRSETYVSEQAALARFDELVRDRDDWGIECIDVRRAKVDVFGRIAPQDDEAGLIREYEAY